MVCWNFQITKQTIEHKLWALSRYKKSPLYKRIKTIRAISCIGIMLFLAGLEIYEALFHYTPKPYIIFGFAIADFIVVLLTWNLAPWAIVKGNFCRAQSQAGLLLYKGRTVSQLQMESIAVTGDLMLVDMCRETAAIWMKLLSTRWDCCFNSKINRQTLSRRLRCSRPIYQ